MSRRAETMLLAIWDWDWDEENHGVAHAVRYIDELRARISDLGSEPLPGRPIGSSTHYRYVDCRRARSGHGHVIVFRIDGCMVYVTSVYHTAQDWRTKLEEL